MEKSSPVTEIKGIGPKTEELFQKTGVYTVGDILLRFPRTYMQYPPMIVPAELNEDTFVDGKIYAISLRVDKSPFTRMGRNHKAITTIRLSGIEMVWFSMPYIKNEIKVGRQLVFYGKLRLKGQQLHMEQPKIFDPNDYQELVSLYLPIYSIIKGISNDAMQKVVRQLLNEDPLLSDYLPNSIRKEYHLCEYNYSIKQIHFPDSMESLIDARRRLVFDEFFLFIMNMRFQKQKQEKESSGFAFMDYAYVENLLKKLPFTLTEDQMKSLKEIANDLSGKYRMQRLLQGDVGSGKTIIAFLLMAWASHLGYQSAIMAPTEVLASQHYETFCKYCKEFDLDIPVVLLTGQMKAKEKRESYQTIAEAKNAIIVGTHALIQEKVVYQGLSLVITDEQHRFGVKQREAFSNKGLSPHILVMSATPIPRTLGIILYGDLDISVIDHVPSRRLPIKNSVVGTRFRSKSYDWIKKEVDSGHQAYVICPLVEESENAEGENVIDYTKRLQAYFGDSIQVGTLHGKMKGAQKVAVMEDFLRNEIQVLVSTTVVEVGVNVPNATVMLIENADKFGLAQLHQLRGRVGRGDAQSYCIFMNTSTSKAAQKRLEILNQSNDGFYIASCDLKLRGPGDFFGIRQSGDLAFKLADIYQDATELEAASEAANRILEEDPELSRPYHQKLRHEMEQIMSQFRDNINL